MNSLHGWETFCLNIANSGCNNSQSKAKCTLWYSYTHNLFNCDNNSLIYAYWLHNAFGLQLQLAFLNWAAHGSLYLVMLYFYYLRNDVFSCVPSILSLLRVYRNSVGVWLEMMDEWEVRRSWEQIIFSTHNLFLCFDWLCLMFLLIKT